MIFFLPRMLAQIPPLAWLEFVGHDEFLALLRVSRACLRELKPFPHVCLVYKDSQDTPVNARRVITAGIHFDMREFIHLRSLSLHTPYSHAIWATLSLPASLTELHIESVAFSNYDRPFLPKSLRILNIRFLGELRLGFLPDRLWHLTLHDFNTPLVQSGVLPESLEYICLPHYTGPLRFFPTSNLRTLEMLSWSSYEVNFRAFRKLERLTLKQLRGPVNYFPESLERVETIWDD